MTKKYLLYLLTSDPAFPTVPWAPSDPCKSIHCPIVCVETSVLELAESYLKTIQSQLVTGLTTLMWFLFVHGKKHVVVLTHFNAYHASFMKQPNDYKPIWIFIFIQRVSIGVREFKSVDSLEEYYLFSHLPIFSCNSSTSCLTLKTKQLLSDLDISADVLQNYFRTLVIAQNYFKEMLEPKLL